MHSFYKAYRSEEHEHIMQYPHEYVLLSQIAYRAAHKDCLKTGLVRGEARIGDYMSVGLSRQQYRTTLNNLCKWNYITIKSTNRGTIARIVIEGIYEVTDTSVQPPNQPTGNHLATTNKNKREYIRENRIHKYNGSIQLIIQDLNTKAGTKYRYNSRSTVKLINARLDDKFTVDDFYVVHTKKVVSWRGTKWAKFLRPETLYSHKFEAYLNEPSVCARCGGTGEYRAVGTGGSSVQKCDCQLKGAV